MNSHLISYFDELREQIIDKEKWDKDRFHVFNYEAGSGKSQNTFRFLAKLSEEHSYRCYMYNDSPRTTRLLIQ